MFATFAALDIGLYLAIAVVLVRKYRRTRDVGLVWLGVFVFVWPPVSQLLKDGGKFLIERTARHQSSGFYTLDLVERHLTAGQLATTFTLLQQLVGIILLFVAVLYLQQERPSTVNNSLTPSN